VDTNASSAGAGNDAAGSGVRLSPFCVHLQSKKRFFLRGPALEESDVLDASQHCWCRLTLQLLGPDGEVVEPRECRSGRSCFADTL
jgi:hypothetical protein